MKKISKLDEMQREILFRIEEIGVGLAFWTLLAAIIIQLLLGLEFRYVLGEACVFVLLSIYLALATLNNGLWAVSVAPNRKSNALFSLVPAVLIGALSAIKAFVISHNAPRGELVWQLVLTMLAVYAGCFLLLEIMRMIRDKRRSKLDDEEE